MFSRSDTSLVARWWWSVDKWTLGAILFIISIGILLNFSVSPAITSRIGLTDQYGLLKKQLVFVPAALAGLFFMSFQSSRMVRRWALIIFSAALILSVMTLFTGDGTKGANRWISIFGHTLQPSEFLKPSFAVLSAWLLAESKSLGDKTSKLSSAALAALIAFILFLQPDIGMLATVMAIWGSQIVMAGLPLLLIVGLAVAAVGFFVILYFTMPHFQFRVDSFLDPEAGDKYQISSAIKAFQNGGLFGIGPGEGKVKMQIPDPHTDFIMAVAGEEFGFVLCMVIISLFAFVILRGFLSAAKENNMFSLLAVMGLWVQFAFQAAVNMMSSLHLMPTKGMTLPFISHGGSSLISLALGMGFILALTKKRGFNGD